VKRWTIYICPVCGRQPGSEHKHGHRAEAVEVVPLSEVREALLGDDPVVAALGSLHLDGWPEIPADPELDMRAALRTAFDAAFASTDSEGQDRG